MVEPEAALSFIPTYIQANGFAFYNLCVGRSSGHCLGSRGVTRGVTRMPCADATLCGHQALVHRHRCRLRRGRPGPHQRARTALLPGGHAPGACEPAHRRGRHSPRASLWLFLPLCFSPHPRPAVPAAPDRGCSGPLPPRQRDHLLRELARPGASASTVLPAVTVCLTRPTAARATQEELLPGWRV